MYNDDKKSSFFSNFVAKQFQTLVDSLGSYAKEEGVKALTKSIYYKVLS